MKPTPIDLDGAVVAITGGARGIGRATAAEFVRRGATVLIGDLDADTAAATANELGESVHAAPLDVADAGSFQRFLNDAAALGPLQVLVNNAGIMPVGRYLDQPQSVLKAMVDVNIWGVSHGMRLALPPMIDRGQGHVVNVASLAGRLHLPGMAMYCATKWAVLGLSLSVRDELAGTGVTVSTVLPSAIATDLAAGIPGPFGNFGLSAALRPPAEVARVVVGTVRTRAATTTAPSVFKAAEVVLALTPAMMHSRIFRLIGFGPDSNLYKTTAVREDYDKRITEQARLRAER